MIRKNVVAPIALVVAAAAAAIAVVGQRGEVARLEDNLLTARARAQDADRRFEEIVDELAKAQTQLDRARLEGRRLETNLAESHANERPDLAPTRWTMPDGKYFAYIAGGTFAKNPRLEVDLAQWFVGEEAKEAAVEDGRIDEGDTVPNDYYIRNRNPQLRLLFFSRDAQVTLSTWSRRSIPRVIKVSLTTFGRILSEPRRWESNVLRSPYWITVSDGRIVRLEEQYLP